MCVLKPSVGPYSDTPFHFVETGINVYSFEELLFHCYHYWKESANDLENGSVSAWVKDTLGLAFVSAQIDSILSKDVMLSEKYLKFLSLENYFDEDELILIEHEITVWENKSELEKLKQQGDERLAENDYEKAAFYYERLLEYSENAATYNNIGCCRMKLGMLSLAEKNLTKATELEPRNPSIKLNTAMLYLLQNREGLAENLLLSLEKTDNDRYIQYYLGDLELRRNNLRRAAEYFERSAKMGNELDANAALCKIALRTNDFESARKYVERIPDETSSQYLENMAKINCALGDKNEALKNAEQLVIKYFGNAGYWALCARLYRETGELTKAAIAVDKAMEIDEFNEEVIFENARIKKELGKTFEYQTLLSKIIENWSRRYKVG